MPDIKIGGQVNAQQAKLGKQLPQTKSLSSDGLGNFAAKQTLSRGMQLNTNNPFALPPLENDEEPATLSARAGNAGSKIYQHLSGGSGEENGAAINASFDLMAAINGMAQQSDSDYDEALSNLRTTGVTDNNFQERLEQQGKEAAARTARDQLGAVVSNDTAQQQNQTVAEAASAKFTELLGNKNVVGLNTGAAAGEDDPMRKLMAISFLISSKGGVDHNAQPGQDLNINRLLFTAQNIRTTMANNSASLALNLQQPMAKAAGAMQFGRGPTTPGNNGPGSTGGPQSPISE